jgi:hypothetical protein
VHDHLSKTLNWTSLQPTPLKLSERPRQQIEITARIAIEAFERGWISLIQKALEKLTAMIVTHKSLTAHKKFTAIQMR